jgi:hypothetical protein
MNDLISAEFDITLPDEAIRKMLELPQAECGVTHFFGVGVYIKEARVSAGVCAIGALHKTACTNVLVKGRVMMVNPDGSTVELVAPLTFVSYPGRKMGYIIEDMIWQNVCATDETDASKLEDLFLVKDAQLAAVEASNRRRADHTDDIADYEQILVERGMTEEEVRKIVENEDDMIRLPYGTYKFILANSEIQGRGVFATSNISEGEIIGAGRIGMSRTILGRYTNHAKVPNTFARCNGTGGIDLIAATRIKGSCGGMLGEEITIDYRQARSEAAKLDEELKLCQVL